jgi:hypothetical protein
MTLRRALVICLVAGTALIAQAAPALALDAPPSLMTAPASPAACFACDQARGCDPAMCGGPHVCCPASLICDGFEDALMSSIATERAEPREAATIEAPRARDRWMCIGGAHLDDPLCWTTDPHGLPLPHSTSLRFEHHPMLAATAPHVTSSDAPRFSTDTSLDGVRAAHARRIDRPPRLAS